MIDSATSSSWEPCEYNIQANPLSENIDIPQFKNDFIRLAKWFCSYWLLDLRLTPIKIGVPMEPRLLLSANRVGSICQTCLLPKSLLLPVIITQFLSSARFISKGDIKSGKAWFPQAAPVLDFAWYPAATPNDPASYCFVTSVRECPVKLLDASDGRVWHRYL